MSPARSHGPADAYIHFYETLAPSTLNQLDGLVTADVRFCDPFNDVTGVQRYKGVLAKSLDVVPDIKFTVSHQAVDGEVCFLRWRSVGTLKVAGPGPWIVEGMSELRFASDGRIREHIDYWDAAQQFYESLPVIGSVLRRIRRRVAH